MDYKLIALEVFAIAVCYVIVAWPLASATSVNIIFNGQPQDTAELSSDNLINKNIRSIHSPSDVTWTNVEIEVLLSSASLTHTIDNIYLYKCKTMDPASCIQTEPVDYDHYTTHKFSWKDISEREGASNYPQVANLLTVIKISGPNGRSSWIGSWDTVRRTAYDTFNVYSHEVSGIDFYAKSLDIVQPAKSFIESYQMLPFNWAEKVIFQGASSLTGLGATETEIQASPPQFESAKPQSNQISGINKDFYLVLSDTTSGISSPSVLNLNPSFECGDNICETDLGETEDNCCFDCGCEQGEYCDMGADDNEGSCEAKDGISIQVQPLSVQEVTDCAVPYSASVKMAINNAPKTLPDELTAYMTLGDDVHTSTCTKGLGPEYTCEVSLNPDMHCGSGTSLIGPNMLNVTLSYSDGPNTGSLDISTPFPDITVPIDCGCQDGYYCDSGQARCLSSASIGLQVINITSYMNNYNAAGDSIVVTARITNPPSDLTTPGTARYFLGSLYKGNSVLVNGTSGNAQCTGGASTNHVYTCSIPIHIDNYDHEFAYYYRSNSLSMTASYSNGGTQVVDEISVPFTDITIPSYRCGDGTCNTEEDTDSCCLDCGCTSAEQYCDAGTGCNFVENISLSVLSVQPKNVTDCKRANYVNITAKINNIPHGTQVNRISYLQDGEQSNWAIQCQSPSTVTGIMNCVLQIPPIDDCVLPFYTVGSNDIEMTITYPDGLTSVLTRDLSAGFQDIHVIPTWHCGTFGCESDIGESGENCCIDCGCEDNEYCDYHPQYNPDGSCGEKQDIRLVIDRPSSPLFLKSCEKSHRVNVQAHIENQPSGMLMESWYAELGGESTSMVYCRELRRTQSGLNISYNCSIIVPSESDCSKGDVNEYDNNTLSLFISYPDGVGQRTAQTLSSQFPMVTTTQSIRSVYDITQEATDAMQENLQQTLDLMEQLMDLIEMCIYMTIAMAIAGMVASFAVGFGAEGKFSENFGAAMQGTQAALTTTTSVCNMITQSYQLAIRMKEVDVDMIQMQMCLELQQHMMDEGLCDGREQSCFGSLTSCIDFGTINSVMRDATTYMNNVNSETRKVTDAWKDFGEAYDDAWGGAGTRGTARLVTYCGDIAGDRCCDFYNPNRGVRNPQNNIIPLANEYRNINIKVQDQVECGYPVVKQREGTSTITLFQGADKHSISLQGNSQKRVLFFSLYCFDDRADYERMIDTGRVDEFIIGSEKEFLVGHNEDEEDDCAGNEWPASTRTSTISTGSILNN